MELKVDCSQCGNQDLLRTPSRLKTCMMEMAKVANMTTFGDPQIVDYPFSMQGDPNMPALSGVLFLGESSLTIHTYPEYGTVFIDVFHCLPFDCVTLLEWIVDTFKMKEDNVDVHLMERGLSSKGNPIRTRMMTRGILFDGINKVLRGRRVAP